MHEVAEPGAGALAHLVLPAARLPKVGDGAELRVDGAAAEPAVVEVLDGPLGVLLAPELDVDVANQVVAKVVAHVHLFNLSVLFFCFHEAVFEKVVVMLLCGILVVFGSRLIRNWYDIHLIFPESSVVCLPASRHR